MTSRADQCVRKIFCVESWCMVESIWIRTGLGQRRAKTIFIIISVPDLASQEWQDPLEAILVIFGRRALIFFVWKLLEKIKMTPLLCACAVVITLETKNVEKGHLAPSNWTFWLIAIDRNGFRRMKEEGQIYKGCLRFFNFCLGT